MTDLSGKHALVTGGGTGVGETVALTLAKAGAKVTISGRRAEPLAEVAAKSDAIEYVTADVTNEDSVRDMYVAARKFHGPVDIVIPNAGAAESAPMAKVTLEQWQRLIDVNLTGVFLTCREALADMRSRGWGRIIPIASIAGRKGYAYVVPYCSAKHGVIGLTRALAAETAKQNITVNAVCPGYMMTPLVENSAQTIMDKTSLSREEALASMVATNPQARMIETDEVAETILWLCGPGSQSVTGQTISISGGETT